MQISITLLCLLILSILFYVSGTRPRRARAPKEIKFFLYNAENSNTPVQLQSNNKVRKLRSNELDASKPVKIITHGYAADSNVFWSKDMRNNYIKIGQTNVIQIDWGELSRGMYTDVAPRTKRVAHEIALLIVDLIKNYGFNSSDFHFIGHSLGAHIAGFTGKEVRAIVKQPLGRITGLDPAGPLFLFKPSDERLDKTDATFVDVIHSDITKFGSWLTLGDADFWPNGGSFQPGCVHLSCSHERSPEYFAESILYPKHFPARKCASYNMYLKRECCSGDKTVMGEYVNKNAKGHYYVEINREMPYGVIDTCKN